jgi:hypothetical protein
VSYDVFLSIYDVFLLTILSFWIFQKGNYHLDLFSYTCCNFRSLICFKKSFSFYISSEEVIFLLIVELVFLFLLGLLIPISLANFLIYVGTYKLVLHLLLLGLL